MTPDELRALVAEATPGPWWYDGRDILSARVSGSERSLIVPFPETFHNEQQVRPADARLIALAPELAALCADLAEALESILRPWERPPWSDVERLAGHIQGGKAVRTLEPAREALARFKELEP